MGAAGAEIKVFDSSDAVEDVKALVKFDRNEGSSVSLSAFVALSSTSGVLSAGAGGAGSSGIG